MERIHKNIEDERVKCFLMGFSVGLGFGMRLHVSVKASKVQADMGGYLEERSIIDEDSFIDVPPDLDSDINFEKEDIKDVIPSDNCMNIASQENNVGKTDSSLDSCGVMDIASESDVPQMLSDPKEESLENTGHLQVGESNRKKKLLECDSCLITFKTNSSLNRHNREKTGCRLRICKEPHDHMYTVRKFSSLDEAVAFTATIGKFNQVYSTTRRYFSEKACVHNYCRNRYRFGCKASWGLRKSEMGYFVFTGCLKHVDSCLEMGDIELKKGQRVKPKEELQKRIRPKRFKCDKCHFKTTSVANLKKHIKSVHDKIKDMVCQKCDYTCSLKSYMDSHMNSVHLKVKNYVCEECGYSTSHKSTLNQHQQSVHLNIRRYVCEQCAKAFNKKSSLNVHKRVVHLKIRKHVCQYCEYAASSNGNLIKHTKAVHKDLSEEFMHS